MTNSLIFLRVLIFALCSYCLQAQNAFTVAFDPMTTVALGGYEVELGFNMNKSRITASYLSGELSPWFAQAADFENTSHSVIEIAYSRFLNQEQKGFSYGLAFAYYTDFTVDEAQGESLSKNPSRVAVKLAYAWFPFKSIPLYLEPSMTFGFLLGDDDLNFTTDQVFNKKSFIGNGPLFNVGYKFEF